MNPEKFYYPLNLLADFFGKYWTLIVVAIIVGISCVLMAYSLVVYTIKDWLISMLIRKNPIIKFIKENGLLDTEIALIDTILSNENIKQFISKTKLVLDQSKLTDCWLAIKDDVKNMTVAQLEDLVYIMKLVKKSNIITVLLSQVKILELKKYVNLLKSLPYNDIIDQLKTCYAVA